MLLPTLIAAVLIKDVTGAQIVPPLVPRIVSVAPAMTEIIYAIGAGSDLVADSDYCDFPAAARLLPHVGALNTLNLERMVAFHPNLILTASGRRDQWISASHLAHSPVFMAQDGSIDAVCRNIEALGSLTGKSSSARGLVARIKQHVANLRSRTRKQAHPRVFYLVWPDPLQGAGPGSYLDELITTAGGRNVLGHDHDQGLYPLVSWEVLIARRPDILVGPKNLEQALKDAQVRAKARKVAALDSDIVSRPGPRVVEALDLLYRALH